MSEKEYRSKAQIWASFRYSVIGRLFTQPIESRILKDLIQELADTTWTHPTTGEPVTYGFSTIESWYYQAKRERKNPIDNLHNKPRTDRGKSRKLNAAHQAWIKKQYQHTPHWRYSNFATNLAAYCRLHPEMGKSPSNTTVRRFMKANGLIPIPRCRNRHRPGYKQALEEKWKKETLTYECTNPGSMLHLDFHACSRSVVTPSGEHIVPVALAILDDHSRLCCHMQWYKVENTKFLIHGLIQAFLKCGVPRSIMSDNGKAMKAAEYVQGLRRMSITLKYTLDYSPWQNGKLERFWETMEMKFMDLLDQKKQVTIKELNEYTQVWVQRGYNHTIHSEIQQTPWQRYYEGEANLSRTQWEHDDIVCSLMRQESRKLRGQDGTLSVESIRFQVPSLYHDLERFLVRYAKWDLTRVYLVCPITDRILVQLHPVEKNKNAQGKRPARHQYQTFHQSDEEAEEQLAPVLEELMEEHQKSGLPFPYLPYDLSEED